MPKNTAIQFRDLGTIDYAAAWRLQQYLQQGIVQVKMQNRKQVVSQQVPTANYLLFCNHPHVYTLGKSGSLDNLLLNEKQLAEQNIQFYQIGRGGDITYHGPDQIVGYPILDLDNFMRDLHKYLRLLESAIICTLADYGLDAGRIPGATGVWLDYDKPLKARKICAMGIRCSRWVTMHGWAFNINTDLQYFNNIIPCGIRDKGVTSLHVELGLDRVDIDLVKQRLKGHFARLFEAQYIALADEILEQGGLGMGEKG
jgi:lipoyl(octanoyl) transferase